jgi:heptosyltransferase-2
VLNFNYQKILIVRLSSLGDILLTTPVIRSLKRIDPNIQIDFLVRDEYEDVLVNNPNISNLFTIKRNESASRIKAILSQNNYDLVVDLQNNLRSRNLISGLNCEKVKFQKHRLKKFILVKLKINMLKEAPPIPVRYASAIQGLKLDDEGLDLFTNNKPSGSLTGLNNLIGICPGSRHFTKMWPKEYYIELGKILTHHGFHIVLFGGKSDKQICNEISSVISNSINLCNDDNILQTASDMKMCTAIVCNDSGLMHTAAAVKVPVVAIFGSTVREFGFSPYNCNNLILENKSLSCRPCSHIGRSSCPKKHFKCMKDISPQMVYNNLTQFLSSR